jgi:hypothetical protein
LKVRVVIEQKHADLPAYVLVPSAKLATWKLSATTTVEGTLDGTPFGRRSLQRLDERHWFLELKKTQLEAIGKSPGARANLVLQLASAKLPTELQDLIDSESTARASWEGRTDAQRRMLREHVLSAKRRPLVGRARRALPTRCETAAPRVRGLQADPRAILVRIGKSLARPDLRPSPTSAWASRRVGCDHPGPADLREAKEPDPGPEAGWCDGLPGLP